MTLPALSSMFLTYTELGFSKIYFEHLHSSYVANPSDDTSALNNHHHLDLCWIFFNVNNKTILYPCAGRADGALVRRVPHYIALHFAAVVCSLSSYCWAAVNQSWKRLWHGRELQDLFFFFVKIVFLSGLTVLVDSIGHILPSFLPFFWLDGFWIIAEWSGI